MSNIRKISYTIKSIKSGLDDLISAIENVEGKYEHDTDFSAIHEKCWGVGYSLEVLEELISEFGEELEGKISLLKELM